MSASSPNCVNIIGYCAANSVSVVGTLRVP
jgi:hypothetical protein